MRNLSRCHDAHRQEILTALGLAWIAPELRENRAEIEAAARGELAPLIELRDLQGDLHAHTSAATGANRCRRWWRPHRLGTCSSWPSRITRAISAWTRILRALERPCVSILGHPTGRLLGERAPYAGSFDKILDAARARPCVLELNAQPACLDMDDILCKAAHEHGVLVSVASDAHSGAELSHLAAGIRQARRGWLGAKDVLNARPLREVKALLAKTRR